MGEPRATGLRQALELYEVAESLVEQRLMREGGAARDSCSAIAGMAPLSSTRSAGRLSGPPGRFRAIRMDAIARGLTDLAGALDALDRRWALIGGLAVSCHVDPRFTREHRCGGCRDR